MENMQHAIDSPATGHTVAGGSFLTGWLAVADQLESWLGLVSLVLAIILTFSLIIIHWRKERRQARLDKLKEAHLQRELEDNQRL